MATYTGSDKRLKHLFEKSETVFGAATATEDGTSGIVPAPLAGEQGLYLQANGTWSNPSGGGGGLPGTGYTGSDLILRDENGNICGVWYIDANGSWVEYKTDGNASGHTFSSAPTWNTTIVNSFEITSEVT